MLRHADPYAIQGSLHPKLVLAKVCTAVERHTRHIQNFQKTGNFIPGLGKSQQHVRRHKVNFKTAKPPFSLALSQSGTIICRRKFRSGALSKWPQSQHGLTVQNGGAALGIHCCSHHSLPQYNVLGVPKDQNKKEGFELRICS